MKVMTGILLGAGLAFSGQVVLADTINDNYASGDTLTTDTLNNIKSAVNGNDANISTNSSNISTNTTNISSNASDISDNKSDIDTNTSGINSNAGGVSANAGNINGNTTNISTNTTNISTNTSNISTNTSDIATNASDIADNASRIVAVEAATGIPSTIDFTTGYGMPFSADGSAKNVSISRRLNPDGTTTYSIRSRYANSSEQISVQGVLTTRPFIANYGSVTVDSGGSITSISNYIEAPLTSDYEDYVVEQSSFDTTTLAKTITADTGSELWNCGTTVGAIQVCNVDVKVNDSSTREFETVRVMELLGAGEVDGLAFTDMRGSQRTYDGSSWYEVRAKDIGRVLRLNRDRSPDKVIFYRVGGSTDGSLAGTPFDTGQLLENFLY